MISNTDNVSIHIRSHAIFNKIIQENEKLRELNTKSSMRLESHRRRTKSSLKTDIFRVTTNNGGGRGLFLQGARR